MEHLQHFGLAQDPFSNEPDLRFFFESASHRDAQRRVERGLRQHKGLTLLTGDGGMGKTMLARRILEALEEEVFEATLLVMLPGTADATGILQRFARQIGADEPAEDRAGLLSQIYERLAIVREDGRHAVLMVDDAQIMTPSVFAELGGILNLEYEDRRLVSVLFVGSPDLDRLVQNDPSMAPRVDVRVRLQPLDLANTTAYLSHRLGAVQGNPAIVPPAVIETLNKFGRGRPRLLNTLADNALFEAYLAGRQAIDPMDVERAAADLGIGADPGSTFTQPPPMSAPTSVHAAVAAMGEPLDEFRLPAEDDPAASSSTLDLDAGLEDALKDFDDTSNPSASAMADMTDRSLDADALSFDDGLLEAEAELDVAPEAPRAIGEPEEEFMLAEAELSPMEDGDGEELEGIFVELIEE